MGCRKAFQLCQHDAVLGPVAKLLDQILTVQPLPLALALIHQLALLPHPIILLCYHSELRITDAHPADRLVEHCE